MEELLQVIRDHGFEYFGRYYSSYVGYVSDNKDPEGIGRVKLKVPQVYGDDVHEYWAPPKGIISGKNQCFFCIPEIGSAVWVSFQQGDPAFPLWEYGLFVKGEVPDSANNNSDEPTNAVFKFGDHTMEFDVKNAKVSIKDSNDNTVVMDSTGVSVIADKISLGKDGGSNEPAVLGDKTEDALDEIRAFCQEITTLLSTITADAAAAASNGLTYPSLISSKLPTIINKLSSIATKTQLIKSSKVTLD